MLEKIFFCLEQLFITKKLIELTNSNFYSRVLSRVFILRCQDFLKLSDSFFKSNHHNQPTSILITDEIKELKDEYAQLFLRQRNKLSGHFQDLEFGERNTLWMDIENDKLHVLFNKIYNFYKKLNIFTDYIELNESNYQLSDSLISNLRQYNESKDIEKKPMMSSDALSLTRFNTCGIIYCHPLQDKCGVIVTIDIILDYEKGLFSIFQPNDFLSTWLKIVFIVDIISFLDNLFTRPIPETSIMYNKGLDKLIEENNHSITNTGTVKFFV